MGSLALNTVRVLFHRYFINIYNCNTRQHDKRLPRTSSRKWGENVTDRQTLHHNHDSERIIIFRDRKKHVSSWYTYHHNCHGPFFGQLWVIKSPPYHGHHHHHHHWLRGKNRISNVRGALGISPHSSPAGIFCKSYLIFPINKIYYLSLYLLPPLVSYIPLEWLCTLH